MSSPNPGNMGGASSPNGGATPVAKPGSNGMGDSQRNYLVNAYPLGSPSTPSTKQEIIAEYASGLGFYPDALSLGTPKELIQPYYPIQPPKVNQAVIAGSVEFNEIQLPIQVSTRFNFKKIESISLEANTSQLIEGITAKLLVVQSTLPITVLLDGIAIGPPSSVFFYCNFISTASVTLSSVEPTDAKVYIFT